MFNNFSRNFSFSLQKATGDRSRGSRKSGVNVRITSFEAEKRRTRDAFGDVARFQEAVNGTAGRFNENAKGTFTNNLQDCFFKWLKLYELQINSLSPKMKLEGNPIKCVSRKFITKEDYFT